MPLADCPSEVLERVVKQAASLSDDLCVQANHVWWALYGHEFGFFRDTLDNAGSWKLGRGSDELLTNKDGSLARDVDGEPIAVRPWTLERRALIRREWLARFVRIKDTAGNIVPLVLNVPQRDLEFRLMRAARAGRPARVRVLKVRQIGISTFGQGCAWELALRREGARALLIAHRKKTAQTIFGKVHTMRRRMPREDTGGSWAFDTPHKSRQEIVLGEPMDSTIDIDSAEADEPGHGETIDFAHLTETARWPDAEDKLKGLLPTIPDQPGTVVIDESTANGDVGPFRDGFWQYYEEPGSTKRALMREHEIEWESAFYAWFIFPEYRWSYVHKKPPPAELVDEIARTLDEVELRLLKQRYFVRGVGWKNVDYDQLAWRRETKRKKSQDSWHSFNEQYPGFPEDAFLSSGWSVFDNERLKALMRECLPAATVGDLVEHGLGPAGIEEEREKEAMEGAV